MIAFTKGETEKHEALIENTKKFLKNGVAQKHINNFNAYITRTKLWNGDQAAAKEWLNNYYVNELENLQLYKIYQHFTTPRAYIVTGDFTKAKSHLTELNKLATKFNRFFDKAEVKILESIVEWYSGSKSRAVKILCSALKMLEPYRFIQIVANEGKAILPVLRKIVNSEKACGYEKLDRGYLNDIYIATVTQSKLVEGIVIPKTSLKIKKLSERQKDILELLAEGFTTGEISEKTGLTVNTIKSHKRVLYEKLGVNNIDDALMFARENSLI